ncbi:MAG: glycosyltransferase [Chloroflexota bacterium]|nr:glycosyltransferase [Chloroflexota bacterium]
MAHIWCLSAPLFSHTDWGGFLKTAQHLQAGGHRVTWVSEDGLRGAVERAGVPFAAIERSGWLWPPPPAPDVTTLKPAEAVMLRYRRALDTWMSEDLVGAAVESILRLAAQQGKPDLIMTDPFLSAAALAAEALDVPLVVCGWLAQREMRDEFLFPVQKTLGSDSRERLERLGARFGLQGHYFSPGPTPAILSPHLHISYFTPRWYIADEDTLLPQTLFVGGAPQPPTDAPPTWLTDIPADAPIALITLGTTFAGDLGFYSWAAQAAARAGFVPIVVIGFHPFTAEEKAQLKAALPKTTRLLNWIPFDHVLPRTRLMFHHGGMGTTHAALVHGIPQVVVPHAADQRGQARRAAQAKVGLNLTAHDVKQGMLFQAARALASDAAVLETCRSFADEMAALGGPARAAAAVELLMQR